MHYDSRVLNQAARSKEAEQKQLAHWPRELRPSWDVVPKIVIARDIEHGERVYRTTREIPKRISPIP